MIFISSTKIIEVLLKAGYKIHKNGIWAGGLIKNERGRGRWHAVFSKLHPVEQGHIEIHYDYFGKDNYHITKDNPRESVHRNYLERIKRKI